MGRAASVGTSWTRSLVAFAAARGEPRDHILRRAGVTEAELAGERIAERSADRVWADVVRRLGPGAGLDFAASGVTAASLGVVGYLAMASATLGEALGRVLRFAPLLLDVAEREVRRTPVAVRVAFRPVDRRWPAWMADAALASYMTVPATWAAEGLRRPHRITFQHGRPDHHRDYDAIFGCPVEFDAPWNAIEIDRAGLDAPLVTAQPLVSAALERTAGERLAALGAESGLAAEVDRAIATRLGLGAPSLDDVAHVLGVAPRTLQRRLEAEGRHFQELVEARRHAEALRLFAQPGTSVESIAERLGFSDARALRRAFRRWTGRSPRAYRAALDQNGQTPPNMVPSGGER